MTKAKETHVVMLPWSAFGHMIPFLDLSCALANKQIHVSYVQTPRNIQRLPKIPPNLSPFIHFVSFPLPQTHPALPESAEATVDIPTDKIDRLKIACDLLHQPIRNFIAEQKPNWIVTDFFQQWAADISQELSIPLISFNMFCTSTNVFYGGADVLAGEGQIRARPSPESMTTPPPWVDFPSKVAFSYGEAIYAYGGFYGVNATGISDSARIAKLTRASRVLALRTCPEFDSEYLKLYSELTGKLVIPVGFLPPERKTAAREESWNGIFDWLDKQKPRSVIFVGFGSETKISKQQICEIAYGLELSGLPFLWTVAKPEGIDDLETLLPPEFRSRTAAQGVVQMGWAPQREILGHASIGGSFFHAGWGSIIEALQFGHAMVLMPLIIDQPLNARLMVEKDLGVEVERGGDGSYTRDAIAAALKQGMLSEDLRARAKEAALQIFGDHRLNQSHFDKFAEYLKSGELI